MNKCETLLEPGRHRLINIAGVEMFSDWTSGGFFVGRDSPAICFMKKDGQFITTMSDRNLKEADGIRS